MNKTKKQFRILTSFTLAMIAALVFTAFPGTAYAAGGIETVSIGSGSDTVYEVPYSSDWNSSRTQIIYKAEDIGRDGAIVSIAYEAAVSDEDLTVNSLKIWMGYADYEFFDYDKMHQVKNSEQTFTEDDLTLVYSGTPDLGASQGWEVIDLDEAFDYRQEQGNLVIVAGLKTGGGSNKLKYYSTILGKDGSNIDKTRIAALYTGDQKDPSIADLSYSGSDVWKFRSVRPNIKLEMDTSTGGEVASCEVSFDTDGGAPVPDTQTVSRGGKAAKPDDPSKEGYRFTGWYKGDNEYNFDSRVNNSFTLKAGWIKTHTIKFVGWNNEELQSSAVDDGQKPEYEGETPQRPSEGGKEYIFAGWDPPVSEADSDMTYTAVFVDRDDLADKTALNGILKTAADTRTGVKTSEDGSNVGKNFEYVSEAVWQAYNTAITSAQDVADNPVAEQPEVDQAAADLSDAIDVFLAAKHKGTKALPEITDIVISKYSGRQQPAVGGSYEWKVTFAEGTDLSNGKVTDDDFQIQRKPSGAGWKNSKCPYVSFSPSESAEEKNVAYLTGMAIPDNTKAGDTTNLWRFIYAGDSVDCPVITQDGYVNINKTGLVNAISDARDAAKDIKVSADGWDVSPSELFVTSEEMQALEDAIADAEAVNSSDKVTQAQVDNAVAALQEATRTFTAAKKGGNGEDEQAGYLQGDYRLVYETGKAVMPDIPVRSYTAGVNGEAATRDWFTEKSLSFEFYDTTTQQSAGVHVTQEGSYTDENGDEHRTQILTGVELIRGHRYIVSVNEPDYMIPAYYTVTIADDGEGNTNEYTANMANYYISLSESGAQPKDIKNDSDLKFFDVMKRESALDDLTDAKRVNVKLPVYYTQDGTSATILSGVSGAVIKLVSPAETLIATSDSSGQISVSMIEDMNYMVQLVDDSGALALPSFPLVVKDHAENGWPKSIYNHYSCGSVQGLYLVDKQYGHANDTTLVSISGKTSVTGQNFMNTDATNMDRYFINDMQLDNSAVSGLEGWDYEVFRVDAINMFRTELSRLAAGSFDITREVPAGREVEKVCFIDKKGKLKRLEFAQNGSKITYSMSTLSMYPNVIVYKAPAPAQNAAGAGSAASVSGSRVDAASVQAAIAAAGGNDAVTEIVIEKNVKKIGKGAFAGTNIKTIIVKSKKLKKKSVKGSLKGSAVTTVKVQTGKAKTNKKYVKKYKKIFTKKNAGKKVKVKK